MSSNQEIRQTNAWRRLVAWAHDDLVKGISAEANMWAADDVSLCGFPADYDELRAFAATAFEAGRRFELLSRDELERKALGLSRDAEDM